MRKIFLTGLLTLTASLPVHAENMGNMSGPNMQQMMLQMQKMQQCLMQIDEAELRRYESQIAKLEPELRGLCQQGQRDKAQAIALDFAKQIAQSESVKIIEACTKNMQANAFMPKLPDFENLDGRHVCDELKRHPK